MSLLGGILKNLNPLKLLTDAVGGWAGSILRIATTLIQGIASGRPFGEIMKDVVKEVAMLAIKAAITAFTGGTAGLFINTIIDKAQGILGQVAAKVLTSSLSPIISKFVAGEITKFSASLTTDLVRDQITKMVLDATGLKSTTDILDKSQIDTAKLERGFSDLLTSQLSNVFSPAELAATQNDMAGPRRPRDEFVARK